MVMSYGLQTFDNAGKCIVDTSSRLQKYLGDMYCEANSRKVSTTNGDLINGTLWYLIVPDSYPDNIVGGNENITYLSPSVYTNGTTLTCEWGSDHVACRIIYGVY